MKALDHHVPTDDDIADLLKEFTVDFLLKGEHISMPSIKVFIVHRLINHIFNSLDT